LAFTVERFFTISKPLLARTLCTMERTKKVILITWIFTIIYCSPWFGLTEVRSDDVHPDRKNCDFRLSRELYIAVFGADLVLFYIVPLVVAVVVYAKIARILCSSLRMLREGGAFTPRTNRSSLNSADSTGSDVPPIPEPRNTQTTHNQLLIGASAMRTSTERQLAWTIRSRVQVCKAEIKMN
jgi:7 transmembrane receptor (rhodopsin family)